MTLLLPLLGMLLHALGSSEHVHASYSIINQTVNGVGATLPTLVGAQCDAANGACGFIGIATGIIAKFRPLLTIMAILSITIFGLRMIIGQEDDVLEKAKPLMTGLISGLVLSYLIDPFISAFYGTNGEVPRGAMATGTQIVNDQVNGLINWALVIVASLAVLMIVIAALKALLKPTNEEGIANLRKTFFSIGAGILLLVFRATLGGGFVNNTHSPIPILTPALQVISYLMGFLALAAVAVVIYAGIQMIFTLGNEEQGKKARALLGRAAIGFILILVSLVLVNFVVMPGVS